MNKQSLVIGRFFLIVGEILLIAYLNYKEIGSYYSLDVFYCLPVIHAARLGAIHTMRRSDTQLPTIAAIVTALVWSMAEASISWPDYPFNAFALNLFSRGVTFTVVARVLAKVWKERDIARKDSLTDLGTRLEFFDKFAIEQLRSERSGIPYSLLFIDIDQFKLLNDNHGHHVGDMALKLLADILRENSRRVDTVTRFGGDEFVLLVPETDERSCAALIDRIKLSAEKEFQKEGWPISLSIGHVTESGRRRSVDEILHEADMKMYSDKKSKL
jgi:diguanylate cyclase (GGDEF)-like protein